MRLGAAVRFSSFPRNEDESCKPCATVYFPAKKSLGEEKFYRNSDWLTFIKYISICLRYLLTKIKYGST